MKKRKKRSKLVDSYSVLSEFFAGHFKSRFRSEGYSCSMAGCILLAEDVDVNC